jgi:exopolysaccharide biosynthesis polyprenyl glycosylphosphotransferase
MILPHKKEALILLIGDVCVFILSLYVALFLRSFDIPEFEFVLQHVQAFLIIWILWIVVYFIAGLYEKHTSILRNKIPTLIFNTQMINNALAIGFFYLIPYFVVAPKTILFICLVLSFGGIVLWRTKLALLVLTKKKEQAIIIGSGNELKDLYDEVNNNSRYSFSFIANIDLNSTENIDFQKEVLERVYSEEVTLMVVDLHNGKVDPILKHLYNLIFSKVRFVDLHKVYEDIFDRIPLSAVRDNWFMENISIAPKTMYDSLKRVMDILIAFPLFILSLPFYIFVFFVVKLDDKGSIFFSQKRIGKNNKLIHILKFRSMSESKNENQEEVKHITKIGKFLRSSRIDELPQLINVLRGDISLIGPRPEMPDYVKLYEKEIPYYNVRHLLKPGLSGWAQMHQTLAPKFKPGVEETRVKISYDFYYIKNRSFMLDLKIALQTIKTLLSRSGV